MHRCTLKIENKNLLSQVFLLFYAVLYGALFTLSERWRPFFTSLTEIPGIYRIYLSYFMLGILPIIYFAWMLITINKKTYENWLQPITAVYATAPVGFLYMFWTYIVRTNVNTFYSTYEQTTEPVKSTLAWVGKGFPNILLVVCYLVILILFPILLIILPQKKKNKTRK